MDQLRELTTSSSDLNFHSNPAGGWGGGESKSIPVSEWGGQRSHSDLMGRFFLYFLNSPSPAE